MSEQTRRSAGSTSLALLVVGFAVLAATTVVLAITASRHLAATRGAVLPVSWCRSGSMTVLVPFTGARWFTAWQWDPVAGVVLAAVAALYLASVSSVAHRQCAPWSRWRTGSFLAGLGVCVIATCGPIAVYDMALFSAHMLGHLALVMVAPPLLVAGRPMTLALHATRNPWHTRIKRTVRSRALNLWFCPLVALATYAVVIVGTHLTGLMDVIMARPWAGQLEHLVYLLVGYQLFALVLGDEPLRWRLSLPAKELLLAVGMAIDTFTGVVLLQSTTAISMTGMSPNHSDPLTETHLGGAIMWVGGDAIMAAIMMIVAVNWLRRPEHRQLESRSWLAQVRSAQFDALTDRPAGQRPIRDVDSDDRTLTAYNEWLERISRDPRS